MLRKTGEQLRIEMEMSYTTWDSSCKEPGLIMNLDSGDLDEIRACRRSHGHDDGVGHASGFGAGYRTW